MLSALSTCRNAAEESAPWCRWSRVFAMALTCSPNATESVVRLLRGTQEIHDRGRGGGTRYDNHNRHVYVWQKLDNYFYLGHD
jgi:hypothetical protein